MPGVGNSATAQMLTQEEQAAADHLRYVALTQRRSAPPRCHPVTIVILVMSGGLVFIGLTMTIIAHWPGSTSIGENPLKIVGPVLLSAGFLGFIIGIVMVGLLNTRERKKFVKTVNSMAASRIQMSQSQASMSAMNNSGVGMKPPPQRAMNNLSHDDSSTSNFTGAGPTLKGAESSQRGTTYGNPQRQASGTNNSGTTATHSSSLAGVGEEVDGDLPQPVRVRRPRRSAGGSRENLAGGNSDESRELLNAKRGGVEPPPSYDSVELSTKLPQGRNEESKSAARYGDVTDDSSFSGKDEKKKKKPLPPPTAPKPQAAGATDGGARSGSRGNVASEGDNDSYRLRVHVKAAPGATVSIRQGSKENIHNKSTASIETDF